MSKDRKKLLHIHSSVNDKQPTPATLELGELGVNNAKGNAFISTKNSDDEVVRFSEDATVIDWMERKEIFPYEGYVRGSSDTISGVTEQDLLNNKSNIIFKLNQVVPDADDVNGYGPYDKQVNGAKDIYGNAVNPPVLDGEGYVIKDGAGFAVDMSRYAMIGANPSFSSVTTTCRAEFNGTTEVKGSDGSCGSYFGVDVANACIDASETLNEYGEEHSNFGTSCDGTKISKDTTLKGDKIFIDSPKGDKTIKMQACEHISGKTNDFTIEECTDGSGKVEIDTTVIDTTACTHNYNNTDDFKVTECSNGQGETEIKSCKGISGITDNFVVSQCGNSGSTNITSCKEVKVNTNDFEVKQCNGVKGKGLLELCDEIRIKSDNVIIEDCSDSGETTIDVNDLCLVGRAKTNVYGDTTNIGLDCDDSTVATKNNSYGKDVLVSATTGSVSSFALSGNINENAININENATNINEVAASGISETAVNISETASNDITNTASHDICDQASNEATFYGAVKTNVGVNCNGIATATTTSVEGGDVMVNASIHDIELTAKRDILAHSDRNINMSANGEICESANASASFAGMENTNIGITCDGSVSDYTLVKGADINVYADDILCESGNNVTIFANGNHAKLHIGGNSCSGDTDSSNYDDIVYVRKPDNTQCGISASTVDGALHEVFDRSKLIVTELSGDTLGEGFISGYTISQDGGYASGCGSEVTIKIPKSPETSATTISLTKTMYTPESELLCKYTLHQYVNGVEIPVGPEHDINIPKDHLLRDVELVYGKWDGGSGFTACTQESQADECHWYIKMEWNVWTVSATTNDGNAHENDSVNGHPDHLFTYLPVDDLVKDIVWDTCENTDSSKTGVIGEVYYDEHVGKNKISADTTIQVETTTCGTITAEKNCGTHTLSTSGLTISFGAPSGVTDSSYNPFCNEAEIILPTSVCDLDRGKLTLTVNGVDHVYDPCTSTAVSITSCDEPLKVVYGSVCDKTSGNTYSPCSGGTITIPQKLSNLTYSKLKLVDSDNNVIDVYDPGSGGTTCTPGEKTITIPKSCDEPLKVVYGSVCDKTSGSTYSPCSGGTITVPQKLSNLTYSKLKLVDSDNNVIDVYDPGSGGTTCTPGEKTITIPKSCDEPLHVYYGSESSENKLIDYYPCSGNTLIIPKVDPGESCDEPLKVVYGSVCDKTSGSTYSPCSGGTITVPQKLSNLTYSKLKLVDSDNNVIDVYDPGSGGTTCTPGEKTITIPKSCDEPLKVVYGSVCDKTSGSTYSPCSGGTITVPKYIQHITGGKVHFEESGCTGNCLSINSNVCVSGSVVANSFFSRSDRRLKDNISTLSADDIEKVNKIQFKSFNFKDDETKTKTYGVIAQEVQESGLENIVHTNDDGMLNVDYTSLLLLKIASMEKTIIELSTKVNLLTNRLNFGK